MHGGRTSSLQLLSNFAATEVRDQMLAVHILPPIVWVAAPLLWSCPLLQRNVFILTYFILSTFLFVACAFGLLAKKSLPDKVVKIYSFFFPAGRIVSCLTRMSWICFELAFVNSDVRAHLCLRVQIEGSRHHVWRGLIFLHGPLMAPSLEMSRS